jgi:hypothetical protein
VPATQERRELIARLVEDRWDSEGEFDQFFATITDPEELHLFAYHFNMDTGIGELRKVVQHPLCDRGTLLLVYWRLSPGWFYAAGMEITSSAQQEQHALLKDVEQRFLMDEHASAVIFFDPRRFRGGDLIAGNEQYGGLAHVAPKMFEPTSGVPVRPLWGG